VGYPGIAREVPLTRACVAALREQAARVEVLPQHGQGPVWPGLAALRPDGVTKRFKTAAKRADMPDLRLHDLRHGFACRLREAGVAIQVIAQLAGHKSLATTLRYSRHMAGTSLRNAIDALQGNGGESAPEGHPADPGQGLSPPHTGTSGIAASD
jgi:integrase